MEKKKEILYVIKFNGMNGNISIDGYYSEKQPNYEWSFTNDIKLAKYYKNIKQVEKHIIHASQCSYRNLEHIIEEYVVDTTIKRSKTFEIKYNKITGKSEKI